MWVVFGLNFPVRKKGRKGRKKSKEVLDCYWRSIQKVSKYISKITRIIE